MDIGIVQEVIQQCAPSVPKELMRALVRRESDFKQFAIGMDSKHGYVKQPSNLQEAVETIEELRKAGRSFSVGLGQIHISNVVSYNLSWEQAFDPCVNLHTSEIILWQFYNKALNKGYSGSGALFAMLRGYNSGNVEGAVSNEYASAILKNASLGDYKLNSEGYKNINLNVKLSNLKVVSNEANEEEIKQEQHDFFSNKSNTNDDFFKRNKTN